MNKHNKMYYRIEQHGDNLNGIFNTHFPPIALCKKLLRIENKARQSATDYCNGVIDSNEWESISASYLQRIDKILDFTGQNIPVFINPDARGYALKIDDSYMIKHSTKLERDWGGYGLIAPDLS